MVKIFLRLIGQHFEYLNTANRQKAKKYISLMRTRILVGEGPRCSCIAMAHLEDWIS
jgi:hypothetical protein